MIAWTLWNLFLAGIPIPLGIALARRLRPDAPRGRGLGTAALFAAWLLMLPNAPYLMTEIRHFVLDRGFRELTENAANDPAALRLSAAWGAIFMGYGAAGLFAYMLAVRPVERALWTRGAPLFARVALAAVVALGVWLGLVPRFNSWDAVVRTGEVLGATWWAVTHAATTASIAGFAVVLLGLHAAADVVLDAVLRRARAGDDGSGRELAGT
jgi:uncharacterized membrane protein